MFDENITIWYQTWLRTTTDFTPTSGLFQALLRLIDLVRCKLSKQETAFKWPVTAEEHLHWDCCMCVVKTRMCQLLGILSLSSPSPLPPSLLWRNRLNHYHYVCVCARVCMYVWTAAINIEEVSKYSINVTQLNPYFHHSCIFIHNTTYKLTGLSVIIKKTSHRRTHLLSECHVVMYSADIFNNKTKENKKTNLNKQNKERPTTLECKHLTKLYLIINDIPVTNSKKKTKGQKVIMMIAVTKIKQ